MNGYDALIYLIGFLTLLFGEMAIAKTDSSHKINRASQQNNTAIVRGCNNLSNQAIVPAENSQTTAKIQQHFASKDAEKPWQNVAPTKLWWALEQFDPFEGKLVQDWLTYPREKEINLVVNWQLWTLLDYLGRYRFVNQFGTVAREYGYSLNIFNQKKQCLAVYKYNSVANPPKWELHLEKLGQDSLQVKPVELENIIKKDEGQ